MLIGVTSSHTIWPITGINVDAPLPNPIPRANKIKYKANHCTRSPAAPDNPAARWCRACMHFLSRDPTDDEGDEDYFPIHPSVNVLRYAKPRPTTQRNPTGKNNAGTVAAAEPKQPLYIPQKSAGRPNSGGNDGADGSDISHVSHGSDSHDSDGDDLESRIKKDSSSSSHSLNGLLLKKEHETTRIIIDLTDEPSCPDANDIRHRSSSTTNTSTRSHQPKDVELSSIEAGGRTSPWSGAIYRFLTYDSSISQVTPFESNSFFGMDECSRLDKVLSRLENPAQFAPYFESMVCDGYDIVTGGGNIIVFKKRCTEERSPGESGATRCKHCSKELSIVLAGLMGEVPCFEEEFFSLSEENF
ncbi:hypothetical protein N7520_001534 [Penicillium odoratum]|uniref:uncharacterized protein n=1 Tax=Penicillium odoratum TaxID=1167516 RepID=UPI002547A68F|nr:uncharacterized protein N7520_001534 [Penicillium odoratum]KAJ5778288.1 hypothetical protein N7520_001534 [Penicillium odoratum]